MDNGSTDGTWAIALEHEQQFPHSRLIQASDKRSAAYARNVGARFARGDSSPSATLMMRSGRAGLRLSGTR